MKSFKTYLAESKLGNVSRAGTVALVVQVRSLTKQVQNADAIEKKLELVAQQNQILSYMIALNLAYSIKDGSLARRFRLK